MGDDPCESSNHSMLSTIAHCHNSRRVRGCRQWVCKGPGSVCMGKPPSSAFFHLNPGGSGACRGIILRNYMSTCSALHVAQRASSGIHQRRRWSALWYGNEGEQAAVAADPSQPPGSHGPNGSRGALGHYQTLPTDEGSTAAGSKAVVPHSHADPAWVVVTAKVHTVARCRGRQLWVTTPANLRTTACSAPLLTAATHAECVAAGSGCVRVRLGLYGQASFQCIFPYKSWWQWCLPWHNPAKLYVHVFSAACSPACKQWNSSAT